MSLTGSAFFPMFSKVCERINKERWPALPSFSFTHHILVLVFNFGDLLALLAILAGFSVRMFSTVSALLAARCTSPVLFYERRRLSRSMIKGIDVSGPSFASKQFSQSKQSSE
jgi:hypothetical protein